MNVSSRSGLVLLVVFLLLATFAVPKVVVESEREIPVVWEGDIVVIGGNSAGVTAAVEAARQGRQVFVVSENTFLGVDMCSTYRLYLEPGEKPDFPLGKKLFNPEREGTGLEFFYSTDIPSQGQHLDTSPPSRLDNRSWSLPTTEAVEFGDSVTITIDLGSKKAISQFELYAYQNKPSFWVDSIRVFTSNDKEQWQHIGDVDCTVDQAKHGLMQPAIKFAADIGGTYRYLNLEVVKPEDAPRMLLGEVIVYPMESDEDSYVPRPIKVKRILSDALREEGIGFIFGSFPVDILVDGRGNPSGVIIANRSGRQAIVAKKIIDATMRATVARLAGAEFAPYPSGPQVFQKVVLGGKPKQGQGIESRNFPAPDWNPVITHTKLVDEKTPWDTGVPAGWDQTCIAYKLIIDMPDGSFSSFARAEQIARDMTFSLDQFDASQYLFQIPPDPVKARKSVEVWPGADRIDMDVFMPRAIDNIYVLNSTVISLH